MKRLIIFAILPFVALFTFLHADEFIVKSFSELENDLSARKYVEYDINGDACALIKVRTDIIKTIQFDSNMGIPVAPEQRDTGEYWVYVNEGERALKLMAEGFIPKTVALEGEGKISSLKVYELQISSKELNIEKLPVTILTEPQDAEKWIDGERLGNGDNYIISVGKHELSVKKDG